MSDKGSADSSPPLLPDSIAAIDNLMCGCGDPGAVWEWIKQYLTDRPSQYGGYSLGKIESGPEIFCAYILDHLRITEHGGSVMNAWRTEKGDEVLEFLNKHGAEWGDEEWIDSEGAHRGSMF